ncbi:MAG: murein biosynthesis integral membrane protein MurJ [Bdellovibrionaceae bacterium]|nr:murein biosynthesis integral membrane protein MurJ [Pseudobdellovibrionaceae bacterium]|tara:strand:+ start:495 stop:2135 length:1641 start_codon:yes stop_codon:yes gene_type:complete
MASDEQKEVTRAAGLMSVAVLMSRILGLVREQVFAFFFGAGVETDAFQIAFRIPNLFRDLFAEGSMSSALVPTFIDIRQREGERRAWRLAGLAFRSLFLGTSLLAVIGICFAPEIVEVYASSFHKVEGQFELTVELTRILYPFFPFVVLAAAFMAILNANRVFFLPAFASALFNLTTILTGVFGVVVVTPYFGWPKIYGMAIGFLLGGVVQCFSQYPKVVSVGYRWIKRKKDEPAWYKDPGLKKIWLLMGAGTFGMAATQVNILVSSLLATGEGPGAVSWLNYAFRLMQFPIGVFGVSLAAASLPLVSRAWSKQDIQGVSSGLFEGLKKVFAVNFPAMVGLMVLSVPLIRMIFQYGAFGVKDTQSTAYALIAYAVGLVAYSGVKLMVPICYATGRTRVAILSSLFSVVLNISFNLILIKKLSFLGLALGTSIAALSNFLFLLILHIQFIRARGGVFHSKALLKSFFQHLLLSGVMGGVLWFSFQGTESLFLNLTDFFGLVMARVTQVMSLVILGALFILGGGKLFSIHEIEEIFEIFTKRLKSRLK